MAEDFGKLEKVSNPSGFLEFLIQLAATAGNADIVPEFVAYHGNAFERFFKSLPGTGHSALVSDQESEFTVEAVDASFAARFQQAVHAVIDFLKAAFELRVRFIDGAWLLVSEVIRDGRRENEVSVGKTLHQGGGSKAVGAMVGKVRLPGHMKSGKIRHQVVIDPEPSHRVVDCWENLHGGLVGVLSLDLLIHLEEIAVSGGNGVMAVPEDGVTKVEVDAKSGWCDPAPLIADLLGRAGGYVPGGEVSEGGVLAFEILIPVLLLNISWFEVAASDLLGEGCAPRHPDATIIAKRLGHQG